MVSSLAPAAQAGSGARNLRHGAGCRLWDTSFQQFRELLGRYRLAEIVPLRRIAVERPKKLELVQRFHALGNDAQLEAFGHADHRGDNRRILAGRADLPDERLVDFKSIKRKPPQVAQAGAPGAEIVDPHP